MNNHVEDTMRKVFLNMTMTFDGFFAGPHGELDWMSQTPDQELRTCDRAGSEHLTPSHSLAPGRTT